MNFILKLLIAVLPASVGDVFRAGNEIKNVETWKNRQALAAAIFTLLTGAVGIANFLGYPLPIPTDTKSLESIAALLGMVGFGVFQLWATYATTKRIGLPPQTSADGTGEGSAGPGAARQPEPDPEGDRAGDDAGPGADPPMSILTMDRRP